MHCTCTNGCEKCGHEHVIKQVFNCPGSQRVVKHQHIVKYHHDTINEYDVIHEHEYSTRDVVREREIVKHNDYCPHEPNYCKPDCTCGTCNYCCGMMPMPLPTPYRRGYNFGRRW